MKRHVFLVLLALLPTLCVSAAWFTRLLKEGAEERLERELVEEAGEHLIHRAPPLTRSLWIRAAPRLLLSGAAGGSLLLATDRLTDPHTPPSTWKLPTPWRIAGLLWFIVWIRGRWRERRARK